MKCDCCESELQFTWTDTHGVGVCVTCGLPYEIYHYENEKRVEGPPVLAIKDDWLPICQRYWKSKHKMVVPGGFDIGILRSRGHATYSGATESDMIDWENWCKLHKSELPKPEPEPEVVTTPPA